MTTVPMDRLKHLSYFQKRFILGAAGFCLIAVIFLLSGSAFNNHWRRLRDGMTEAEVKLALGTPTAVGKTLVMGAGDQYLTRWEYKRGHWTYCVDFDYLGPEGAPVLYRTERINNGWRVPSWWPWWYTVRS